MKTLSKGTSQSPKIGKKNSKRLPSIAEILPHIPDAGIEIWDLSEVIECDSIAELRWLLKNSESVELEEQSLLGTNPIDGSQTYLVMNTYCYPSDGDF